jgi:hypothetical protein
VGAVLEGFPSGQREQTVNLPALRLRRFESSSLHQVACSAGVAQLVEHQPSKLNVAGSIPVSRSGNGSLTDGREVEELPT